VAENGRCPFDDWLGGLKNKKTQAVITNRVDRLAQGNFGLCRRLGDIWELKVDFGPGFRVYFAEDGDAVVVLLTGGDKSTRRRTLVRPRIFGPTTERSDGYA